MTRMMSDYEYIERYKVLMHLGDDGMTKNAEIELLVICFVLRKRGFTLTNDEEDWLPPFTPDAK